jgi:hypothetical protein
VLETCRRIEGIGQVSPCCGLYPLFSSEGLLIKPERKFTADTSLYTPFEEYYEKHKIEVIISSSSSTIAVDVPSAELSSVQAFNQATPKPHSPVDSTRQHHRTRSVSETGTYLVPGQTLSKSHPALSLGEFMNTFGPLIFPIYRAALARKRILIVTHAPVELACNFVYDISILSNIPLAVTDLLPIEPSRLKPLFNVGVHDIPLLEEEAKIRSTTMGNSEMYRERGAWVACTTDEVLAFKKDLWDVIIHMPPPHARQAKDNVWPTLKTNDGTPVKATQRDLRRYRALKCSLRRRYQRKQSLFLDTEEGLNDMNGGSPTGGSPPPTNRPSSGYGEYDDDSDELNNIEEVCEKLTWREIAYSSFIWWASAGEKRSDPEAEDGRLLLETSVSYTPGNTGFGAGEPFESCSSGESGEDMDMEPPTESSSRDQHHQFGPIISSVTTSSTPPNPGDASGGATTTRRRRRPSTSRRHSTTLRQEGVGSEEMDLIAYFHRFTQRIFSVLAESIATAETADSDEDEGDDEEERLLQRSGSSGSPSERGAIFVNLDDVERMGLDRYSEPDAQVIVGIVERWWGAQREVNVERGRIGCCGIECG